MWGRLLCIEHPADFGGEENGQPKQTNPLDDIGAVGGVIVCFNADGDALARTGLCILSSRHPNLFSATHRAATPLVDFVIARGPLVTAFEATPE